MPRDGSGTYAVPEAQFAASTLIESAKVNSDFSDVAAALTASLAKDGQTNPTANLPMATFRHTGVGNAQARTDYAAAGQVQDGTLSYFGTTGGTANAQTLTPAPVLSALTTNMLVRAKIGGALTNTGSTTLQISGLATPPTIKDIYGNSLKGGELVAGQYVQFIYDGTNFILLPGYLGTRLVWKQALSGASVDFDPLPTGFGKIVLDVYDVALSADNIAFELLQKVSSFQTSGYIGARLFGDSATSVTADSGSSVSVRLTSVLGNTSPRSLHATCIMFNPDGTAVPKKIYWTGGLTSNSGVHVFTAGWGAYAGGNGAVTGLRLQPSGANTFSAGTAVLTCERLS